MSELGRETFTEYMFRRTPRPLVEFPDFELSMYLYLVHGLHPGGGFGAILAGDSHRAANNLHILARPQLGKMWRWVAMCAPADSYGTEAKISDWIDDVRGIRSTWVNTIGVQISIIKLSGDSGEFMPVRGYFPDCEHNC